MNSLMFFQMTLLFKQFITKTTFIRWCFYFMCNFMLKKTIIWSERLFTTCTLKSFFTNVCKQMCLKTFTWRENKITDPAKNGVVWIIFFIIYYNFMCIWGFFDFSTFYIIFIIIYAIIGSAKSIMCYNLICIWGFFIFSKWYIILIIICIIISSV